MKINQKPKWSNINNVRKNQRKYKMPKNIKKYKNKKIVENLNA